MAAYIGSTIQPSSGDLTTAIDLAVAVPSGGQAGDALIALCSYGTGSSLSTCGPSDMTGWTQIGGTESGGTHQTVYVRDWESGVSSYNFTKIINGSTREATVSLHLCRDADIFSVIRQTATSPDEAVYPSISDTSAGIVFRWFGYGDDRSATPADASWTEIGSPVANEGWQQSYYHSTTEGVAIPDYDTEASFPSPAMFETILLPESGAPGPSISNVDGDNAVNQGQLVNINVADFTESITSGDIGGIAFPSIPDNDPADDVIQVRMPVTLPAGTYDVTISGATETDTISGVTYAITHQYTAPYAPVDSNSLFAGQSFTEDSYFRIVTPPANGTIDAATAEANSLWGNDVDDIYTPDNGFTGDDTVTLEILYADGTTAQWTATISVAEPDTVGPVIVSVSVPTAGTYAPGDALNFTVNFDENTFRTGVPALNLDVGGSARQANYVSGTDTTALVFRYTVQEGDEDTDGITVSSLTLDGGTLKDSAGNDATLTLNGMGDTSGILIDGVSPTISIGAINTTDTTPTASGSAGDSDSLTLDLDGVDVTHTSSYNITPSGGSWSQQFPELAIGTYTMTLTGVDTVGNETVETATLQIVEPSTSPSSKLLRQLLRGSLRSSLKLS